MFRLPGECNPTQLIDALRGRGIHADTRGPTLRLSPGNVTTMEGVELLLRVLQGALRRR
jgi:hypothetical protein